MTDEWQGSKWGPDLWLPLFTVVVVVAGLAFIGYGAAGDSEQARRVLEREGYRDITIEGGAPFRCGKHDWKRTAFKGTNLAGNRVRGVVCCGVTKDCTVRTR